MTFALAISYIIKIKLDKTEDVAYRGHPTPDLVFKGISQLDLHNRTGNANTPLPSSI